MVNNFTSYLNATFPEEVFIGRNLKLHDTTRTGHKYWGVESDRIENVLEHIYGCLVLSIGLESEYGYSVDYNKIRKILVLHETCEIVISDLTEWDIPKEEKEKIERQAVIKILGKLPNGNELIALLDEFNMHFTLPSEYAYLIDKIEYDMQVKMYEKEGRYDTRHIPVNVVTTSSSVKKIIENGAQTVFDVHYEYDKDKYSRIPCFRRILEETKNY
jgi:5'-deoxynucleotidase YfbR-like HD superfamily hydrolase